MIEYVRFGKSGVKVSQLCLGTMTFGATADEATSFAIMDRYVELGGTFLDTADQYGTGVSEEIVGRWIKARGNRQDIFLASKGYMPMGPGPNDTGLSRYHLMRACEDSLRRLQTDVLDLYQIHRWDPECPVEETMETLNDLVRQGKVKYVGCSNLKAYQLARFLQVAKENHWPRFVSMQPIYSALNRSIEAEILPLCDEEGLGVMVYNPLAGGMLTGKYKRGEPLPAGARLEANPMYYVRYYTEQALDIVEGFVAQAQARGVTPAQLALAWVLAEPRVTCPILGARSVEQLNDTVQGYTLKLTPEERAAIPAVLPGRWVGMDQVYDRNYASR